MQTAFVELQDVANFLFFALCATGKKCGSPCTPDQFVCGDGCCLESGLECDNDTQCDDGSDEKNCEDRMCSLCILEPISILT